MSTVSLLRKSARVAAIASTLLSAALPLAVAAPAAAHPCSDVEVIFARGTNAAPGLGGPGQAFADALTSRLGGRTVSTYGVNYPASYDFLTAADGANDAAARISTLANTCPSTRIVLGGYSQGAAVVDMLAGVPPLGDKVGDVGSAPPLAGSLVPQVAAVAVFGLANLVFSLSTVFALSFAALMVAGAADMVSVYIRGALVQFSTPDEMRGRVNAVNMLFIGSSNELGEFRAGTSAAWVGAVPAAVLGGLCTLGVVGLWARLFPTLRRVDKFEEAA